MYIFMYTYIYNRILSSSFLCVDYQKATLDLFVLLAQHSIQPADLQKIINFFKSQYAPVVSKLFQLLAYFLYILFNFNNTFHVILEDFVLFKICLSLSFRLCF